MTAGVISGPANVPQLSCGGRTIGILAEPRRAQAGARREPGRWNPPPSRRQLQLLVGQPPRPSRDHPAGHTPQQDGRQLPPADSRKLLSTTLERSVGGEGARQPSGPRRRGCGPAASSGRGRGPRQCRESPDLISEFQFEKTCQVSSSGQRTGVQLRAPEGGRRPTDKLVSCNALLGGCEDKAQVWSPLRKSKAAIPLLVAIPSPLQRAASQRIADSRATGSASSCFVPAGRVIWGEST